MVEVGLNSRGPRAVSSLGAEVGGDYFGCGPSAFDLRGTQTTEAPSHHAPVEPPNIDHIHPARQICSPNKRAYTITTVRLS